MKRRKTLLRILDIHRVLVRHGLEDFIRETHFLRPLRFIFYLLPRAKDVFAAVISHDNAQRAPQ